MAASILKLPPRSKRKPKRDRERHRALWIAATIHEWVRPADMRGHRGWLDIVGGRRG